MKTFFDGLKKGIGHGLGIFLILGIVSIIYASVGSTWTAPDSLQVGVGSGLTSASWNKMLANMNSLESRMNSVYNSGTTNTKVIYKTCGKDGPILGNTYDCTGNITGSSNQVETVIFNCPTGYKIISGGYSLGTATLLRQSKVASLVGWTYAANGTASTSLSQIFILCMKVE
ncbi:MAG: hypothetical protein PHZ26_00120 [Candidatus Gracilibacteria bacterium]|nr:hypothetical protein [Candidatus Gracilibacteria bacterium]MDD2908142.1 hypothetical protein [Candidatus Gracilibacteria bacterium]